MKALAAGAVLVAAGLALWPQPASSHYPPAPERPCGTDAVLVKKEWEAIKAPPGLAQITTQAAGGSDGKLLLASDGHKVMRSTDGGCTWDRPAVYTVPTGDVDAGGALPTVSGAVFPGGDASRAFLLVDGVGRAAASQLLASEDGGRTWSRSDAGLPQTGGFRDLVGEGSRLYLTVAYNDAAGDNDPAGVSGALWASADGGRSWQQRSSGVQIERLAVDPADAGHLWGVRADHTIQRSDDGGATWTTVPLAKDPDDAPDVPTAAKLSNWRDVAVARRADGPLTVVAAASESRGSDVTRVVASQDGGRSFKDLPAAGLGPVTSVSFGNSPSQILIVSGSTSTAFHGPGLRAFDLDYGRWRDVDAMALESLWEARPVALSAATRGHSGLRALQFRRDAPGEDPPQPDLIARYTPPDPPPSDPSLFARARCGDQGSPADAGPIERREPVTFEPDDLSVGLTPGRAVRLDLKAALAAVPTPLDVGFLIDSSTSMDPSIDGVKCSIERIARELTDKGVDAQFGLATYRDRFQGRYERRVDLAPFGPRFVSALDNLLTLDGYGEPFRSGLYQTATGAGLTTTDHQCGASDAQEEVPCPTGTAVPVHVDPGQQLDYRPGALHTVLVIGDEPYDETVENEPSAQQVVDALKAKGILAIGLEVIEPTVTGTQPPSANRDPSADPTHQALLDQQLRYFAQNTGAVAPKGGVDCDGGGRPDLQQGDPLVCQIDGRGIRESMGDTLMALLTQFRETADVHLVAAKTSGLSVSVEGGEAKNVDIKKPSELAATAVLSCTAEQVGRRFDLSFAVVVGARTVGTLPAEATCGHKAAAAASRRTPRREPGPPRPAPHPAKSPATAVHQPSPAAPAPAPPHPAALPAPTPQPPSPAPVTPTPAASPSAAASPASMPAASSSPSPAPGVVAAAPQREGRPQVAHVAGEHPMTAWRPTRAHARDGVPAPALITLGAGACGAFGWFGWASAARRRRPRVAVSRVRTTTRR